MLEINTLSFCCLIKTFSFEKKTIAEIGIKYFIIQSISSSILVFSCIAFYLNILIITFAIFIGAIALSIKIGCSPFHQWFINIVKITKWKNRTVLITWQKIAPVFLIVYQMKQLFYIFIIFSVVTGSLSQINKSIVIEVIAFSSVFNLRWIILAITLNIKILLVFSIIYWIAVVIVIVVVYETKIQKINRESVKVIKKWNYFIIIINLAGIPPLAGFLAKWVVFKEILNFSITRITTTFLLIRRINLYIYLRLINVMMTNVVYPKQKRYKKERKTLSLVVFIINVFPLVIIAMYRKRLQKGLFW